VPRPFWLIANYQSGGTEVLRINLASGEEVLPVFSFEDEAGIFLELGASDGWRVRETAAGELTSVLLGPCAGVRRVALDPLPGPDAALAGKIADGARRARVPPCPLARRVQWRRNGVSGGGFPGRQSASGAAGWGRAHPPLGGHLALGNWFHPPRGGAGGTCSRRNRYGTLTEGDEPQTRARDNRDRKPG
jgi:hypothetical protein